MNELKQMVLDVIDEFDTEYECIEINPEYSNNKKLLIHELGHAIGVLHTSYDETHVMHKHVVDNEHVRVN